MTSHLVALLIGAAIPLVTFVVLNLTKPEQLDAAEDKIRSIKRK